MKWPENTVTAIRDVGTAMVVSFDTSGLVVASDDRRLVASVINLVDGAVAELANEILKARQATQDAPSR